MTRFIDASLLRLFVALSLGCLVLPVSGAFAAGDMPTFALIAVAGFASVLVRPGWSGFIAAAVGLTTYTIVTAAMVGFAGLQFLGLALALPILGAGSAAGTVANHLFGEGFVRTVRDPRAWAAAATSAVLGGGTILFYLSLVTGGSPP